MPSPPFGGLGFYYDERMYYQNTQQGAVTRVSLGFGAALCVIVSMSSNLPLFAWIILLAITVFLLLLMWVFGTLTVTVDGEELRHWFGPGFWKKSYLLHDIESAKQVRNSWIFGWGIRLTPHGWLYNVSGLDAVEVHLRSGRRFRIGTDDPQGLLASILQENT